MNDELTDFDSFSDEIKQGIEKLGWTVPMPVQSRAIPLMREGKDLMVQAVTGSGKTGAFGLPIVERLDPEKKAIQTLVLAPTRELASQIAAEVSIMSSHTGVETIAIYGGTAYEPQLRALEAGVQFIAGTPGRVLDHLGRGRMQLGQLHTMIFDEADELLSLGFWPDMKEIHRYLPKERQTCLFSATIPERVRSLARHFMSDAEFISMTEGGVRSPDEIEHYHYIVPAPQKDQMLLRIIQYEDPDSALIFCNTRDDTRYVSSYLRKRGLDADMIQGEMTQAAREQVMGRIKSGELRFLVATDVAARGIDISDLTHVISYSSPDAAHSYLHRTGRTGRAGKTGTAISLVSGLDIGNFKSLQNTNRMTIPERRLPSEEEARERVVRRYQVQIEHALRELSPQYRELADQRFIPLVQEMVSSEEGRSELAAILSKVIGEINAESLEPREDSRRPTRDSRPRPKREDSGGGRRPRRRRRP